MNNRQVRMQTFNGILGQNIKIKEISGYLLTTMNSLMSAALQGQQQQQKSVSSQPVRIIKIS